LDPKGKRVKILPFESGKIFAIRDVWIQMAKVLAKAYLNPFSPSPIPFPATSFPPFHTECIKLTIQNLYAPNQSAYNYLSKVHTVPYKVFCYFLFAICYCCFPFAIGCLGPNGKKSKFFCYLPFCQRIQTGPKPYDRAKSGRETGKRKKHPVRKSTVSFVVNGGP
jgi:hypothetical protein